MPPRNLPALACALALLATWSSAGLAQHWISVNGGEIRALEQRTLEALPVPITQSFDHQPLDEVVGILGRASGIVIYLDGRTLEDASIAENTLVSAELDRIPLYRALRIILEPLDLTCALVDGLLVVTTPEKASNELSTRIYLVGDLITAEGGTNYLSMMDVIADSIAPTTWDAVGGSGSVTEFRAANALVISQTFEVHCQIVDLLAALREARDLQGISPAAPVARHSKKRSVRHSRQPDLFETPRLVLTPTAGWSTPRVHE